MAVILCVEHGSTAGAAMERTLAEMGHEPRFVGRLDDACLALDRGCIDLVLAASRLPDGTALDLLEQIRTRELEIPVIVMTGYATLEEALVAMRQGALDYLALPASAEALRLAVSQALEVTRLRRENRGYRREIELLRGEGTVIGQSAAIRATLEAVAHVAPFETPVAFEGEAGTGKELLARALHGRSARRDRPLVTVNCAALGEQALEDALFGRRHSGAGGRLVRPPGALEEAHRGALLLVEIAGMPPALQARLEKALAARSPDSSGGPEREPLDFRLVATSSVDLAAAVGGGRLLRALRERFAAYTVRTPTLRERPEDIPALVAHFVRLSAARLGIRPPDVDAAALERLRARRWPGNVRELENAVERAVILRRNGTLGPESFATAETPEAGRGGADLDPGMLNLRELERRAIRRALETTRGHRGRAATLLGISERTLRNKLYGAPELAAGSRRAKVH